MTINDVNLKFAYTPGYRANSTELILHHAAGNGSVENIHSLHLVNGWAGIAYHYYIRKNGSIWRGRSEAWLGGHTTNHSNALGICFEGNFENEIISDAQLRAGRELVANILFRYPGIDVYKHCDFNATACPGRNFPFDAITTPSNPEPPDTDAEQSDEPSNWAKDACEWAAALGIFRGDKNGSFNWQNTITREETAVVLHRLAHTANE